MTAMAGGPVTGPPLVTLLTWDGAATPTLTVQAAGINVAVYSGQSMAGLAGVPRTVIDVLGLGKNTLEAIPA
jgi:hypothetical protein